MKDSGKIIISALIAGMIGLLSGWIYGTSIISHFLKGDIGISTFIFLPSKNIIDTYLLLNSGDELKRLEGYYAYRETGVRDLEFLYKRYIMEESVLLKKAIIWTAEQNSDPVEMQTFYKKLYDAGPDSLKKYLQVKINSYELIEKEIQK